MLIPANFDKAKVEAGLRLAMQVGLHPDPTMRPVFHFKDMYETSSSKDAEGVPFDPAARPVLSQTPPVEDVLCALEYLDREGIEVDWTEIKPSRIRVTLLSDEYEQVKGFDRMIIGGDTFRYTNEEMPLGLVTVGVHQILTTAEDDA